MMVPRMSTVMSDARSAGLWTVTCVVAGCAANYDRFTEDTAAEASSSPSWDTEEDETVDGAPVPLRGGAVGQPRRPVWPLPGGPFVEIEAGGNTSVALDVNGDVVSWPWGDAEDWTRGPYTAVAAGGTVCALGGGGDLHCLGYDDASLPQGRFKAIDVGDSMVCGVEVSGEVRCDGEDPVGDIVSGEPNGDYFVDVSVDDYHFACALADGGWVACWGTQEDNNVLLLPAPGVYSQIDTGSSHTCGIIEGQALACWGWETPMDYIDPPPQGRFTDVCSGDDYSCAIGEDASIVCWGDPWVAEDLEPPAGAFKQVACGDTHACALTLDGDVLCWGSNRYGESDVPY